MTERRVRDAPGSGRFPQTGPYAGTDFAIARIFCGGALLAGSALVLVLLPFYPPTSAVGDVGWLLTGLCLAVATAVGVGVLTGRIRVTGSRILIASYDGVVMLAIVAQLAGGDPAPYALLYAAVLIPCAMIQPLRRFLPFAIFVVALSVYPLFAGELPTDRAGQLAVQLVLFLTLSGAMLRVMADVRRNRLDARAENSRANTLARIDGLTGLGNRRAFEEAARRELSRAEREGRPLTLVMVDLDDFKVVNDELGHIAGDRFLRAVADTITRSIRPSDVIFRWAGDEFLVLLPDTAEATADAIVARWHPIVREVTRAEGHELEFSAGAVTARGSAELDALVSSADDAMYGSKPPRPTARAAA